MIENPFLQPPLVEGPQSRSWGQGFTYGFQGPPESVEPGSDFEVEDLDAFHQGMLAGQNAAINGLDCLDSPCVDLNREPPPEFPELAWSILDGGAVAREFFNQSTKKLTGGMIFGIVTTLIDLSIAFETHFDDPLETLNEAARRLQEMLQAMTITSSMELFLGGAVDFDQRGCELQLTLVFRDLDSAAAAARGIGRPGPLFVVRWRTDQSGGATVVLFKE